MEYIKLSYHHLNFEDRTALMLESRKEGFSARKFAELIKRHGRVKLEVRHKPPN
ncbi:hypothetical protein [Acinetobacter ursingii]|uniref:hypothetical protein n=1 Tax=Acinetobacter sp. Ac-14 TaxID=2781976 RepID=UPI003558A528